MITENGYFDFNQIKLKNGLIITKDAAGNFPPLQDVLTDQEREDMVTCSLCPDRIHGICGENNSFDCLVYEMFSGFYLSAEDICDLISVIQVRYNLGLTNNKG